ncbi:MAG: magnetosome biogenesis CDF transporter MamM [Magnetococcales bacterium]|nr:magnetosome biogenesis CDF transporter MamM [Magnetococcales bacterium]MBF0148805.1 magnetosome biogenesis CDF transporter MamM [Magnetococcales bacterium]MBF0173405.1 magnetosome biogenesis CDF transporter MamM [Magnetococcales bacterium]MBF0346470.1 magnetosome biogenesis CDF transporter MamM [Magnetococcales bacterium]MBF0629860.1 magnetosome biogenesis CDF transporter MamM [Magnetococcales bacterium]
MRYSKCVVCYEAVGWIGFATNLILSMLKLFIGVFSGSHALVADGLYSAKDVVTSVIIIVGLKVSRKPLDQEHPFGHGKVEFLLALVIGLVLLVVTGLLFYFSAGNFLEGKHNAPHLIALWTALLSVGINWFLHRYTRCVSTEINSPVVELLSKHHLADGYSSMAVAMGIVGSHYLGIPWLDTVVAMFESIHLIYLSGEIFWNAFRGLMDTAAPRNVVERIRMEALRVQGVREVGEVRTRQVGQELWITLIIGVDPELTLMRAKSLAMKVEEALLASIPHVGDVGVQFRSHQDGEATYEQLRQEVSQDIGLSHP